MSVVNVRSLDALEALRAELARFAAHARETLQAIKAEVDDTLRRLEHARRQCEAEVRRCDEQYRWARAALASCQNARSEDGRAPDCSRQEFAVRNAAFALQSAESALAANKQMIAAVNQAAASYFQEAHRLQQLLDYDLPRARAFLGRKVGVLRAYLAMTLPSGGGHGAGGYTPPAFVGAAVPAAEVAMTSGEPGSDGVASLRMAPDWIERGIRDVSLAAIDLSDTYVHGPDDFRKVPYPVMVDGLHKLEAVVRTAVQQGADGDDFTAYDERRGLTIEDGYRRVYDAFYGREPIRLLQQEGRYSVEAGYHRLFVASALGLDTIPAEIVMPGVDRHAAGEQHG